jgi:hypothetical protein
VITANELEQSRGTRLAGPADPHEMLMDDAPRARHAVDLRGIVSAVATVHASERGSG